MKDIYEEIAGHMNIKDIKGYTREYLAWKKISTRTSCVEEDILTYHKQISFDIHDDIHTKISFHIHNTYPLTYSY